MYRHVDDGHHTSTSARLRRLVEEREKALEKVNNALGGTTENNKQDAKTETLQTRGGDIALLNGGSLRNPIPQIVDLRLVGVYGKSTSLNYGTVQLVFKVKMIANKSSIRFGVNSSYPRTDDRPGWQHV